MAYHPSDATSPVLSTPLGLRTVAEIEESLEKLPSGAWRYRPNEFDDCGTVRHVDGDGRHLGFIANARSGYCDDELLSLARAAGTDPYEAVGRYIETCQPQEMRHVVSLFRDMEERLERIAQAKADYDALHDWLVANTDFDPDVASEGRAARMTAALDRLKARADGTRRKTLR